MLNPYVLLAIFVGWAASIAGAGYWAYGAGQDKCIAEQARDAAVAQIASEAAADAIAKIQVSHTTIRQQATKEIVRDPIYIDCAHPEHIRRLLDNALTNTEPSAPEGKLPKPLGTER